MRLKPIEEVQENRLVYVRDKQCCLVLGVKSTIPAIWLLPARHDILADYLGSTHARE